MRNNVPGFGKGTARAARFASGDDVAARAEAARDERGRRRGSLGISSDHASINIDAPQQLLCGSRIGLFQPPRTPVGRNQLRRNLLGRTPLRQPYNMLRCDRHQRRQSQQQW
jgi:hypothetical protein